MFAPWRSQKSVRKHKDPITGNSFIDVSQHVDRVLLYTSADIQLLCWLLVSVDTRSTERISSYNIKHSLSDKNKEKYQLDNY